MAYAVCPRCEGKGSIVNPNVDGHGITASEMDELGPDFFEDYMGGVYDIRCPECEGNRVVPACDEDGCNRPIVSGKYWEDEESHVPYDHCEEHLNEAERIALQDEREYQAEMAAERRMGA